MKADTLQYRLPAGGRAACVLASGLGAGAAGFFIWRWWTAFDHPNIDPRPHPVMWDVVSRVLRSQGIAVAPGTHGIDDNPLVLLASWTMRHFGGGYQAIATSQTLFLALLVLAAGLAAWRAGGVFAGMIAPWIALAGPMTVGLAVHFDDHLALQALLTLAVAALWWSDRPRCAFLAPLAALPVVFGMKSAVYFSNALMFLATFGLAAAAWAAWLLLKPSGVSGHYELRTANDELPAAHDELPIRRRVFLILSALAVFLAGLAAAWPVSWGSVLSEATHARFASKSVLANPRALTACLDVWFGFHAGPPLAIFAVLAAVSLAWRGKTRGLIPLAGWLLGPMLLITLINKRNDFYLAYATPATYVLVAAGIAAVPRLKWRVGVFFVAAAVLFNWYFYILEHDNYSVRSDRLSRVFDGRPRAYLNPPTAFPHFKYATLGHRIAAACGHENAPVVFANPGGLTGWEAFYTWHRDRRILVEDLGSSAILPSERLCVAANFELGDAKPYTLAAALENFRKRARAEVLADPAVQERLAFLDSRVGRFVSADVFEDWAVFIGPGREESGSR